MFTLLIKKIGNGVMEHFKDELVYEGLRTISDWRKMLSNEYKFDFEIDGNVWPSVERYVVAHNYKDHIEKLNSLQSNGTGVIYELKLKDKGGPLDAQDWWGCACALGRGSPHRRPAHP